MFLCSICISLVVEDLRYVIIVQGYHFVGTGLISKFGGVTQLGISIVGGWLQGLVGLFDPLNYPWLSVITNSDLK